MFRSRLFPVRAFLVRLAPARLFLVRLFLARRPGARPARPPAASDAPRLRRRSVFAAPSQRAGPAAPSPVAPFPAAPAARFPPAPEPEPFSATFAHVAPRRPRLTARDACFALGAANRGPSAARRRGPLPDVARSIALAEPQDCLDAAFASERWRPSAVNRAARRPCANPPPFRDVDYFAALARWLGCAFDRGPGLAALARHQRLDVTTSDDGVVLRGDRDGKPYIAIVPALGWLPHLGALVAETPAYADEITIVPPQAVVEALGDRGPVVAHGRLDPLHGVPDRDLADRVLTPGQAVTLASFGAVLLFALLVHPIASLMVLIAAMTTVLIGYAASRAMALAGHASGAPPRRRLKSRELPEYSILVPLYKEDEGLKHLVAALTRLDYPPDKLDIQFLVEVDDTVTQRAVLREAHDLRCRMTIVPAGLPRTKPRALNIGLRQARGSLVTIFDAEDRPDPKQLRIAAETFAAAPPRLAAVQAHLTIDHMSDNWLTKMFAIEYACLFDHILPMVAAEGRLLLLGGTSNHFRTDALVEAGGWDPYNVTEDADLAVRLCRSGYRIAMIDSHTWEEAPVSIEAWLKQRSRWFKGFIQTWLVHNRQPLAFLREAGPADTLVFHVFILGALTAALAHCAFLVQLALVLLGEPVLFGQSIWLGGLQTLAVAVGYGTSFILGVRSIQRRRSGAISPWAVAWFPVYWVLMGVAVLIAVHDIVRKPHHWRKTTHGVAARPRRITAH
ncbi:glycosyltransferase family 2 protein [Acuticoccus sp. I52.16.1]|uniref:glycosyltransferase family 2 protein n=1 Tax=Acuticoccus sp. I52.16.1 TaxID=2928472 RepID=UPI001FD3EF56|nr:glycosyltransferase family 2 protein [Acuticoccus sp. I52.16.1]UOM35936.1 glycosyltransferase [Acuticoccus sp. I52.16.1]